MKTKAILVAEDEAETAASIKRQLEHFGEFAVDVAPTGLEALRRIVAAPPQALLLDTTLPDMSAPELCRVIRSRERTAYLPCLLLGGPTSGIGLVDGLALGADDYLTKPLDAGEVEARLKAVLRRRQPPSSTGTVERFIGAHIDADFAAVSIAVDGVAVSLTRRELMLLRALVSARNQVLSRQTLLVGVWGSDALDCRIVDSAMWKLRTKLKQAGSQIETAVGLGYRFREPVSEAPGNMNR